MNNTKTIQLIHGDFNSIREVKADLESIAVVLLDHNNPDPYNRENIARRTVILCPTGEFNENGDEVWRIPAPSKA